MVDFANMREDDGDGCEVHEFPNSCAVQVLAEFGYTPEAFDATNTRVDLDRIRAFLAKQTEYVQVEGAGHTPSLQLIVLNEDQIEAGIEDLVLEAGFTKVLETYAASYRNMIALYTKCAWESKEQAVIWLSAKESAQRKKGGYYSSKVTREEIQAEYDAMLEAKAKRDAKVAEKKAAKNA